MDYKSNTTEKPVGYVPSELRAYDVSKPDEIVALAKMLQEFVKRNGMAQDIQGNTYVKVSGWQFAGMSINTTSIMEKVENVSTGEIKTFKIPKYEWQGPSGNRRKVEVSVKELTVPVYKYMATAVIKNVVTGQEVGRGVAFCSNDEAGKHEFDEYAIVSMAQTRAIGKGYRLLLGWVMEISGFKDTPAEEMDQVQAQAAENMSTKGTFTPAIQSMIDTFENYEILLSWAADMDELRMDEDFRKAVLKRRDELVELLPEEERPDFGAKTKKKATNDKTKGGTK